jgi:hypothetical protein
VVIVQLSFVLTERGYGSPKLIGIGAALAGLAMPLGSVLFRQIRAGYAAKLAVSFSLSGIGFFIMTFTHRYGHRCRGRAQRDGIRIGVANPGNVGSLEASASRSRSRYRRMAIILRLGAVCQSVGGPRPGTLIGWAHSYSPGPCMRMRTVCADLGHSPLFENTVKKL